MTQQKSEDRIVPEGPRKVAPTQGVEAPGGGKAVPVDERASQLVLFPATAENFSAPRTEEVRSVQPGSHAPSTDRTPKAESKDGIGNPATLQRVVTRLRPAFARVASNKGAPGPDRQTIRQVERHLPEILRSLRSSLLDGTYQPGDIRRVWIPKAGGKRGLGFPT